MQSVWQDVTLPLFSTLQETIQTDVLVIGGGMAGLLCAHMLRESGVDCVVAEACTIAGGITKNTTAKITTQHGLIYRKLAGQFGLEKAGLYLQANEAALAKFRELCTSVNCDFQTQDNFIYSSADLQALEEELYVLDTLHYPAELVQNLPLPFPTVGAVEFPGQAQFHPLKFLSHIAGNLRIFENTPVREIADNTAITDFGKIRAEKIIVATHFPFLNRHGGFFLKLYQQRSYAIALENAPIMDGMYLDKQENGLSFRHYHGTLILGGGGHRTGKQGGNWQELEEFTKLYYPEARITHRWATQDCMSLDGMPYIGQYSTSTPNLYVATGFNKWGMTGSMAAAQLLCDLVQGKESPYESLFSPSRSMLHPQLGINILESAKNLLTFSPNRCPHLGCALKWNPQEHSWDCPCHGSRFTEDGKLIDNPATGNLKKQD